MATKKFLRDDNKILMRRLRDIALTILLSVPAKASNRRFNETRCRAADCWRVEWRKCKLLITDTEFTKRNNYLELKYLYMGSGAFPSEGGCLENSLNKIIKIDVYPNYLLILLNRVSSPSIYNFLYVSALNHLKIFLGSELLNLKNIRVLCLS